MPHHHDVTGQVVLSVPMFLIYEFVDVLLPYLTAMVNVSLAQGWLSMSQQHAIYTSEVIQPLLDFTAPLFKKTGLDFADMSNFRPVCNLLFMSKVVERAVISQLMEYLSASDLLPSLQSATERTTRL